ncbi:MAG: DUF3310 domain-containing protein [Candidatus Hodarchaeota archaeon]
MAKTWDEIKLKGSNHYKNPNDIEPVDLYRASGTLQPFAVNSIIKYAFRNARSKINKKDIEKIIHYAEMLEYLADHEDVD